MPTRTTTWASRGSSAGSATSGAALGPVALIVFPLLTIAAFGVAVRPGPDRAAGRIPGRGDEGRLRPLRAVDPCLRTVLPGLPRPGRRRRGTSGSWAGPRRRPADLASLPYRLVAVKRCPVCATRLGRRAVRQTCGACGHRLDGRPPFRQRPTSPSSTVGCPLVCVACFLLGLIPVLGVIPGVVYYRLAIVAPFRRYIPPGRGLLLRWGVRLAVVLLCGLPVGAGGRGAGPAVDGPDQLRGLSHGVPRSGPRPGRPGNAVMAPTPGRYVLPGRCEGESRIRPDGPVRPP